MIIQCYYEGSDEPIDYKSSKSYRASIAELGIPVYIECRDINGELDDFLMDGVNIPAICSGLRCQSYIHGVFQKTILASGVQIDIDGNIIE